MFSLLPATDLWNLYRSRYSLPRSTLGLSKAGAQCAPYKLLYVKGFAEVFAYGVN